ncbi:MAG: rod shape-determining protein MreC [Bacteroidales bacterium]|jgi:rod shape-determining protein MreC|nr:rod shape-determining protein MreC [Bacteroidales bacterium]
MRSLLNFLLRIHFLLLFILLEIFSFSLLVNKNNFHKAKVVNFSRQFAGNFYTKTAKLKQYLSLTEENQRLTEENNRLLNIIESTYKSDEIFFRSVNDTILNQRYRYTSARIINNSINKKYNFLTLSKGSEQGIAPEMAVVSEGDIVGVVKGVSNNYSTVISLLNLDLKISSKIKKNGYYGSLSWNGKGYKSAILSEIPLHADIQVGDTVMTSGFSSIFPEGILIGYISNFKEKGGSFYEIKVNLSTDFKSLDNVSVVGNLIQNEKLELEKETEKND